MIAASMPTFNPRVVCVEQKDGYLRWAFDQRLYTRRQEAEPVYRINGMLYLWRRDHLMRCSTGQLYSAPHRILIVPEARALDIDTLHDFQVGEALLQAGMIKLPWCDEVHSTLLERS